VANFGSTNYTEEYMGEHRLESPVVILITWLYVRLGHLKIWLRVTGGIVSCASHLFISHSEKERNNSEKERNNSKSLLTLHSRSSAREEISKSFEAATFLFV
jgi:hypothetical protein